MLPTPFEEYIPKLLSLNIDDKGQALINKIDEYLDEWKEEILNMRFFKDPIICYSVFLDELGYFVNAGLKNLDSERTKRKKIATAIQGHKLRGTWEEDTKQRIDSITGYSAVLLAPIGNSNWDLVGDGSTPSSSYVASLGVDGADLDLGINLTGTGVELGTPGNIYINCHEGVNTAVLTAAEITQIKNEISEDVVPAYYRVYLCYVNASGQVVVYPNGTIE